MSEQTARQGAVGVERSAVRRSVAHNALLNIVGQGAPLLVAIFALPVLTHRLGTARFGVLSVALVILGYFSFFDLGMGRALTKLLAERLARGYDPDIPALTWTTLGLMFALGSAAAFLAVAISPWLVFRLLNVPADLHAETLSSFYLLAASLPLVITTAGLRGILEANQRFDLVNAVRVPMGVFTYAGPLLVVPFSRGLVPLVGVLLAGRVVAWGIHLILALHTLPSLGTQLSIHRRFVRPLLTFGSWMTVTNVVGPLMVTLDRFIIGALASMSAVAYYTAPYEAVTKLFLIPGALTPVLFPAFAAAFGRRSDDIARLYPGALKAIFIVLFPLVLTIVALADQGLQLWLGAEFARNSARVLQWLAVGVLINSLAHVPFELVQAAGRPDLSAKLHMLELPFYLLAMFWLVSARGIEGAAMAWTGRCAIDAVVLFAIARQLTPMPRLHLRRALVVLGLSLCALAVVSQRMATATKLSLLLPAVVAFLLVAWFFVLRPDERAHAQDCIARRLLSPGR